MEVKCNECGSGDVIKAGHDYRQRKRVQRYRCKTCKKLFVWDDGSLVSEELDASQEGK